MVDRTVDVPRAAAPHARGADWARVDQFLEERLTATDVDAWVRSACLLCSNGCGCDIAVKDGRMVGVRGREDRINRGRLGPKGVVLVQGAQGLRDHECSRSRRAARPRPTVSSRG